MSDWFSGEIVANGIRLHYTRTGGDKPPVVLAHGLTEGAVCWTRDARALESEFDVIMYDARHHGRSESPPGPWRWEDLAADQAALIRALNLDQPAVIGHSLGAGTTALIAALHPDVVGPGVLGRAVLEDPPWGLTLARTPEQVEATVATHMKYRATSTEELVAFFRGRMPIWSEEECTLLAEANHLLAVEAIRDYRHTEHDWRGVARKITCPLLLITANHELYRDHSLHGRVTPEVAREAMALLPNARHVNMDTAGHCIHREQLDRYVEVVMPFLREG